MNQVNQRINRLEQTSEHHTQQLNRLNQRLKTVEKTLDLTVTLHDDGF